MGRIWRRVCSPPLWALVALLVAGDACGQVNVGAGDRVGIGTTTPAERLHVIGNALGAGSSAWFKGEGMGEGTGSGNGARRGS